MSVSAFLRRSIWCVLVFCFVMSLPTPALAQKQDSAKYWIVQKIELTGNKKTKAYIIQRELTVQEGDTIPLAKKDSILARNQANLFNTSLFNIVELELVAREARQAVLKVKLQELWYFFPIPLFELSDRNFNEWWTNYGRDLRRTNYGLRFRQDNFRGRRETLGFIAQFGFTQRFGFVYTNPYLTKNQKLGMTVAAGFGQNRSIAYGTTENKLAFVRNERGNARERWDASLALHYRPAFFAFHNLTLGYQNLWVADTVVQLNPNYYDLGSNKLKYIQIGYNFRYDKRDVQAYALRGHVFKFMVNHIGLIQQNSIRQWETSLAWGQYFPIGGKWYWDYQLIGQYLYNPTPYFAKTLAIGYGDNIMRGYELYVIPTQASGIIKQTFKYRLYKSIKYWKAMPIEQLKKVPISIFFTAYTDVGYASDQHFTAQNIYQNKWLYSGGIGLDFFTYYNSVIRLNYAINASGEARLYLNFTTDL